MDRKKLQDSIDEKTTRILNSQDLANTVANLEMKTIELSEKIEKCKNEDKRKKLEAKLDKMIRLAITINSGNISTMNH